MFLLPHGNCYPIYLFSEKWKAEEDAREGLEGEEKEKERIRAEKERIRAEKERIRAAASHLRTRLQVQPQKRLNRA